jgi:hypothetical protein
MLLMYRPRRPSESLLLLRETNNEYTGIQCGDCHRDVHQLLACHNIAAGRRGQDHPSVLLLRLPVVSYMYSPAPVGNPDLLLSGVLHSQGNVPPGLLRSSLELRLRGRLWQRELFLCEPVALTVIGAQPWPFARRS